MAYTKLFSSIVTSTIWLEDDQTRIVWITMLALADKDGEVQGSIPGLARIAGVSVEGCRAAIAKFLTPDPDSRTKTEDGRRVEEIDGGWAIINYGKYRDMATSADRTEKAAQRQRRKRERDKQNCHATVTPPSQSVTPESHQNCQAEAEAEAEADTEADTEAENTKTLSAKSGRKEYSPEFEQFWIAFPARRRTQKKTAYAAWLKTMKFADAWIIITATMEYAASDQGQSEFSVMPATFLNKEMWLDDREAWKRANGNGKPALKMEDFLLK